MIWKIARKEFKEIIREGRFRIAGALVLVLLAVALVISNNYYRSINQQHADARKNARNVWLSQDEKNPHSAAHYGTYAFKPKFPLSLIDHGVDKFAGISIFLEAHKRNEAQYMAAADQTGLSRFGDLTPDFILLFIIPLLIVLIGYNAFTREKESGTLKLLKSQGIALWQLALGKWLGAFVPIFMISLSLFLLAAIMLGNLNDFGVFEPGGLLILFAIYMGYYAVFTNLTLITSALSKNSGIALVSMLTIWILTCLGIPKAASNLADKLHPFPTRQAFNAEISKDKKQGLDGHNPWNKEAKRLEKETLTKYKVDSLHQLPFNYDGYRMQKGEEHEAEIYFKHYTLLKEQHQKQTSLYRISAFFSPFLPVRFLSMAISRTDYQTHWDFADAAEKYRIKMMEALNMDFAEQTTYGDWAYKADKKLWAKIPDFSYEPVTYKKVFQRNANNFVVLLLWLMLSFIGLYYTVKRI